MFCPAEFIVYIKLKEEILDILNKIIFQKIHDLIFISTKESVVKKKITFQNKIDIKHLL